MTQCKTNHGNAACYWFSFLFRKQIDTDTHITFTLIQVTHLLVFGWFRLFVGWDQIDKMLTQVLRIRDNFPTIYSSRFVAQTTHSTMRLFLCLNLPSPPISPLQILCTNPEANLTNKPAKRRTIKNTFKVTDRFILTEAWLRGDHAEFKPLRFCAFRLPLYIVYIIWKYYHFTSYEYSWVNVNLWRRIYSNESFESKWNTYYGAHPFLLFCKYISSRWLVHNKMP